MSTMRQINEIFPYTRVRLFLLSCSDITRCKAAFLIGLANADVCVWLFASFDARIEGSGLVSGDVRCTSDLEFGERNGDVKYLG